MLRFGWQFVIVLLLLLACTAGYPQTAPATGSLEISGRVKIGTKTEKLKRKRFYLFRGGLEANKGLIEKLRTAEAVPRDCFYCQMHASPEFIAWLKAGDCESPYCREITTDDVTRVPEFQAAFQKGIRQFGNKPAVAQKWLTTNLSPDLRDGFYRQRKSLIDNLLDGIHPIQSAMTDSVSVRAIFIDIPLKANDPAGKTTETFLISNLVPMEVGQKSYVWACEVEIGASRNVILPLQVPENDKPVKRCEVIVKDLPVCNAGTCSRK